MFMVKSYLGVLCTQTRNLSEVFRLLNTKIFQEHNVLTPIQSINWIQLVQDVRTVYKIKHTAFTPLHRLIRIVHYLSLFLNIELQ